MPSHRRCLAEFGHRVGSSSTAWDRLKSMGTGNTDVRFGSQAALHSDITPTAASGAKPDVRE